MYLKKIIISGFKSFADRLTISLAKDQLTGVVGPNGAGKSNIIDAVRWVMGEQNAKKLRGERATDIIFSGSERRKPLAMAEVSLVFDNSDSSSFCPVEYRHLDEIALTRRLFADGSREYALNGKQCRLKDISEFFMASSLGSRNYSVIQQGQVDRILHAKPEEIRQIVEEAAGTAVFKIQEGEAQKKITATQDNLSRLDDLLQEIEKQITNLKEQAERCEDWTKLKAKLKDTQIQLWSHKLYEYSTDEANLGNTIATETDSNSKNIADLAQFEAKLTAITSELEVADPSIKLINESIAKIREDLVRTEEGLKRYASIVASSTEQTSSLREQQKKAADSVAAKDDSIDGLKEELEQINDIVLSEQGEIDEYNDRLSVLEEQQVVFQNSIDTLDQELKDINRMIDSNKGKIDLLGKSLQRQVDEKNKKVSELVALEQEHSTDLILLDSHRLNVTKQKNALDKSIRQKSEIDARIVDIENKISEYNVSIEKQNEDLVNYKSELSTVEVLLKKADSLQDTARLLKHSSQDIFFSVLADEISIKGSADSLTKIAISAFELWSQRLIFADAKGLSMCVSVLKNSKDKASLCASLVPDKDTVAKISRWASSAEVISSKDIFSTSQSSCAAVLERVFFVDDDIDQVTLRLGMDLGVTIIHSNGIVLESQFDLKFTGDTDDGVITLRDRLRTVDVNLRRVQEQIASAKNQREVLAESLRGEKHEFREADQLSLLANKALIEQQAELAAREFRISQKDQQIGAIRTLIDELKKNHDKSAIDREDLKLSNDSLSSEGIETKRQLDDIEDSLEEIRDQKADLNSSFHDRRLKLATLKEKSKSLENSLFSITQQRKEDQERATLLLNKIADLDDSLSTAVESRRALEDDLSRLILAQDQKRIELEERLENTREIRKSARDLEQKIKLCKKLQDTHKKVLSESELELEKIKLAKGALLERAVEKYGVELKSLKLSSDTSIQQLSKSLSELSDKIADFGPVNMIASEKYKELSERHEFITSQRDDVENSLGILKSARTEIEDKARSKFLAAFSALNNEFQQLFPILFPSGSASLDLTDSEDPLRGGVEILVRLPGKKQQKMNLFSGGEKALTAISLIFALLKANPTPFCFLDEVDAPLDEANITRYTRVLQSLASRFQFIVISHSRRTMEVFDTLYGVTMSEPGVSKLVSVDMTERSLPSHLLKKERQRAGASASPDG